MNIEFRDYVGVAGDEHVLLTGTRPDGKSFSLMYNRMYFPEYNRKKAMRKIRKVLMLK